MAHEQLALLKALEFGMPDSVALMSVEGEYLGYVPGLLESHPASADDLLHRNIRDTDPPEVAEKAIEAIREACTSGEPVQFRYHRTFGDSVIDRWALVSCVGEDRAAIWFRDISDQVKLERRYEFEHRRLSEALSIADLTAWEWNARTDMVRSSSRGPARLGLAKDRKSYPASLFYSQVHPDDREQLRSTLSRERPEGEHAVRAEYRLLHSDGSLRHVKTRALLRYGSDNKLIDAHGIDEDVTDERSRAEEARRREERMRDLFEAMPTAVVMIDSSHTILYCNTVVSDVFGYEPEELTGMSLEVLVPRKLRGHHAELVDEYTSKPYPRVLSDGQFLRGLTKEGREIAVEISLTPLTLSGESVTLAMVDDMTYRMEGDRGESQKGARYTSLFQAVPLPTFIWRREDDTFLLVGYNAAANQFGGGRVKEYIGMSATEIYSDLPQLIADLDTCYREHKVFTRELDYTVRLTRETRRVRVTYGFASPDLVFEHVDDITDRYELEQQLRRSNENYKRKVEQLSKATRKIRHMSQAVVRAQEEERRKISLELHDTVGGSLTALKMNLAAIYGGDEEDDDLATINNIVDTLVDQVRSVTSRLRPTVLDEMEFGEALETVCGRYHKTDQPVITCSANLGEDPEWDRDLKLGAFRIIQEAVTNAIKHADASRICVDVELAGDRVLLSIQDDGIGFDTAMVEPDGRMHVGLRGMQERAAMAGGSLKIDSSPGEGTSIKVDLPASMRGAESGEGGS